MDVVSEAVGSMRGGMAGARRIRVSGRWSLRFPTFVGVGFHLVLHGSGWLVRDDAAPVAVGPGDVVLVPNGADHGLAFDPGLGLAELAVLEMGDIAPTPGSADFDFLCGAYLLDRGQVHRFLRDMPRIIVVPADFDHHPELRLVADLLADDVANRREGTSATRAALVDLMLVHALRRWRERDGARSWPPVDDPGIAAALHDIHASPELPWTVVELGRRAGLSRTAFTRRFTALVGSPPMAYLIGWRLTVAARQLRETDAPLATIARRVGYATEYAFAAAFRRQYGVSPGRFRDIDFAAARLGRADP